MKKINIAIIGLAIFLYLFILLYLSPFVRAYKITKDRSLDAHCLGYSEEIRDELLIQGKDAHLIGFLSDDIRPGHCMVVVNPYTPDWYIIESYTGQEFRQGEVGSFELEEYLKTVLGGYPTKAWVFR